MAGDPLKSNAKSRKLLVGSVCLALLAVGCILFGYIWLINCQHPPSEAECSCKNLKEMNETYRIVNGTSSSALERGLPWASFFFYKFELDYKNDTMKKLKDASPYYQLKCTATVLSRHWVLTAQHCLEPNLTFSNGTDLTIKLTPYVGAGLDHSIEKIMKSPANFRKVKRFHSFPSEESSPEGSEEWKDPDYLDDPKDPNYFDDPKNPSDFDDPDDSNVYSEEHLAWLDAEYGTDLSLLELEQPWTLGEQTNIYPACLMDFRIDRFDEEFLVVGYGDTKPVLFTIPIDEAWISTTSISEQQRSFKSLNLIASNRSEWFRKFLMTKLRLLTSTEHLILARNPHSSICFGDSGGPLHYYVPKEDKLYVVGVSISTGPTFRMNETVFLNGSTIEYYQCYPGNPGMFLNVFSRIDWIRNVTAGDLCGTGSSKAQQFELVIVLLVWLAGLFSLAFSLLLFDSYKDQFRCENQAHAHRQMN